MTELADLSEQQRFRRANIIENRILKQTQDGKIAENCKLVTKIFKKLSESRIYFKFRRVNQKKF